MSRDFAIHGTARAELLCTCVASVRLQTLVACICRSASADAWRRRLPQYLESPPVCDRPKETTRSDGPLVSVGVQDCTLHCLWCRVSLGYRTRNSSRWRVIINIHLISRPLLPSPTLKKIVGWRNSVATGFLEKRLEFSMGKCRY